MRRRHGAAAAAIVVVALAGCAPATTSPGPSSSRRAELPSPMATAAGASARPAGDDRALELDVGRLDRVDTAPLLELASDGTQVIFSSGVTDGPDAEAAPDLYRHRPGETAPELVWRNPDRHRNLVRIGGHDGTWAFVDASASGERSWNLWLMPGPDAEPILLDEHPGDEAVSSLVPSFDVNAQRIVWTAFDRGSTGTVSQLWLAAAPEWRPLLLHARDAAERELWLPSLRDDRLAYVEIVYSADRLSDERHVLLVDLADTDAEPIRLDRSGRATMPLVTRDAVVWKETATGFNMFNWGRLYRHDLATGERRTLSMLPQTELNYPSAGNRFVAAWATFTRTFTVHDLERGTSRLVERYPPLGEENVLRPHVRGDLLVWLYARIDGFGQGPPPEVRWAWLPEPGSDIRR